MQDEVRAPLGSRGRARAVAALLPVVAICLLCFAALAYAAFHTTANTVHGIGSSTGGGVGSGQPFAQSSHSFFHVQAAMYHVNQDGSLNQQCHTGEIRYHALCYGVWGSAPCKKRAYATSYQIGIGTQMPWHWMRGSTCAGQTHQ